MALSANPVFHSRSKHFEIDLQFVRELVMDKRMFVNLIPSNEQLADILTKPFSASNFQRLRKKLTVEFRLEFRGNVRVSSN